MFNLEDYDDLTRSLAFQSYLSPCLTLTLSGEKQTVTVFQSYLSPCLTTTEDAVVWYLKEFQSYLSPCLTARGIAFFIPFIHFPQLFPHAPIWNIQ